MATIKYWNGSAWELAIVGKQGPAGATGPTGPAGSASLQRFRFVATGGQTSVSGTDANGNTLAYTPGLEEVFINGAAQVRGQDYTATNGTSITGIGALLANDVVEILAWGVFDVANTISNTLIDAKGDILAGSAADTVSRLAVGANDTVLTADSSTATGLKWAAVAGGGLTQLESGTLSGASVTTGTLAGTYKSLYITVTQYDPVTNGARLQIRFNGDSGANYLTQLSSGYNQNLAAGNNEIDILGNQSNSTNNPTITALIPIYAGTNNWKMVKIDSIGNESTNSANVTVMVGLTGVWLNTSAITSITFKAHTGNLNGGTYTIYGVN